MNKLKLVLGIFGGVVVAGGIAIGILDYRFRLSNGFYCDKPVSLEVAQINAEAAFRKRGLRDPVHRSEPDLLSQEKLCEVMADTSAPPYLYSADCWYFPVFGHNQKHGAVMYGKLFRISKCGQVAFEYGYNESHEDPTRKRRY